MAWHGRQPMRYALRSTAQETQWLPAVATETYFSSTQQLQVREPPLKVDAGESGVLYVTFNGTGDTIVAGCSNGNIFFIDAATSQVREPPLRGHVNRASYCCVNQECKCHPRDYTKPFPRPECPVMGHRYAPSLSREDFLSSFKYYFGVFEQQLRVLRSLRPQKSKHPRQWFL